MKTIDELQNEITEAFSIFDDWMDRYNYLIELSRELPLIEEKEKKKEYLIEGCQSRVWLVPSFAEGKVWFRADSDAIITKGIVSLLIKIWSGREPQEIIDSKLDFIDRIGLRENLSPTRANGLVSMIKQMRLYAIAYQAKEQMNK